MNFGTSRLVVQFIVFPLLIVLNKSILRLNQLPTQRIMSVPLISPSDNSTMPLYYN